eukprot:TRINITY_DN33338_c0_g1_i1.p1 TRINITY_DN33338_c0_g1~~TRINITY_DN33338_c0_g1_i1.p1  ORF type:complete len:762 (-),score=168.19 TRINITY_DN33338_c0_g1_i1:156-2441(-)
MSAAYSASTRGLKKGSKADHHQEPSPRFGHAASAQSERAQSASAALPVNAGGLAQRQRAAAADAFQIALDEMRPYVGGGRSSSSRASPRSASFERQQKLQRWADEEEGKWLDSVGRACDGEFQSRGPPIHFLLHAEHTMREERQRRRRDEEERAQAEKAKELTRRTVKSVPQPQAVVREISQRLFDVAEQQRAKQEEMRQRHQLAEDLQLRVVETARADLPRLLAADTERQEPCWERLYSIRNDKEDRLKEERQRQAEEEHAYMEEVSIHKSTRNSNVLDEQPQEAWQRPQAAEPPLIPRHERLYLDSQQRLERRQQVLMLEERQKEEEMRRASVHRHLDGAGGDVAASVQDTHQRLYEDAKLKEKRLEYRRHDLAQDGQAFRPQEKQSPEAVQERLQLLYEDNRRRAEQMRVRKAQLEEQERKKHESESVHSRATAERVWTRRDLAELSDRLSRARSVTPTRRPTKDTAPKPAAGSAGGSFGKAERWPTRSSRARQAIRIETVMKLDAAGFEALRKKVQESIFKLPENSRQDMELRQLLREVQACDEVPDAGELLDEQHDSFVDYEEVRRLLRFVFDVGPGIASDAEVYSLCKALDHPAEGRVPLRRLLEFADVETWSKREIHFKPPPRKFQSVAEKPAKKPSAGEGAEQSTARSKTPVGRTRSGAIATPRSGRQCGGQGGARAKTPPPAQVAGEAENAEAGPPPTACWAGQGCQPGQRRGARGRSPRQPRQPVADTNLHPSLMLALVEQGSAMWGWKPE